MAKLIFILFQAALINNFVLVRFLGVCSFIGATGQLEVAVGMGLAVTLIMVLSTILTWLAYSLILVPLGATFLQLLFFMIIIVSLVQALALFIEKTNPKLQKVLGVYVPLFISNCAVLGVTILNVQNQLSFIESVVYATGAGVGFLFALVLVSSIRERLDSADIPRVFQGVPIVLVTAAILSLSLTVFSSFSVR
jgi:electron transport complex protein RnfA